MKIESIFLLLLTFLCVSCVSFESVKTVGKVGTTLTDYKPLNEDVTFLCKETRSIKGFEQLRCDSLEERGKKLNVGIDILVGYSNVLLLSVKDSDFKLSDVVEQTVKAGHAAQWITANENQIAGSKGIASGIQKLMSGGARRKALRKALLNLNGDVNTVCLDMLDLVNLQKQSYRNYLTGIQQRFDIDAGFQTQLAGKNSVELAAFSLNNDLRLLANKYVNEEMKKLNQIEKTIEAFQRGHKILAKESSQVGGKKDVEVVKEIFNSLKDVYDGIEKFNSPITSN